jgi:rhodanese-related sulfurtransferase
MLNARINQQGYEDLSTILDKGLKPVSPATLNQWIREEKDLIVLDTRPATLFPGGFVPGSISIGLEGRYAEWAGTLLPYDWDILLVTEPGKEEESLVRLSRVGFTRIIGFLEGGFANWKKEGLPVDMLIDVEPDELLMDLPFDDHLVVLDVRKASEFDEGHLDEADNLPLDALGDPGSMAMIQDTDNVYVHCAGGYRSVIACSLLKRQGIHNIRNVVGGWKEIESTMALRQS